MTRLNAAKLTNDIEGIADTRADILKYNRSEFGKFLPITRDTEVKSYKTFINNTKKTRYAMSMNPSLKRPILDTLNLDDPQL